MSRSAKTPLWDGAFLRQPNSSPLSGFADRRSYVYQGKTIDSQTHLGFDLSVTAHVPVVAANDGKVVFADTLGIYGNCIRVLVLLVISDAELDEALGVWEQALGTAL